MKEKIPKIGFSSLVHEGVVHVIPFLEYEEGKPRFMKGHTVNADCCHTDIIKTADGSIVVRHSVIH